MKSIYYIFPVKLREGLLKCRIHMDCLEEIRVRVGQPLIFWYGAKEWYYDAHGMHLTEQSEDGYIMTEEDLADMVMFLSRYSVYAFEEEMHNGFVTLEGGHRVGIAGQVRMEQGKVADIRYISFLNIRVAKQKQGCARNLLPYLIHGKQIYNTLLVSAPGIGKTTYLRDCIRMLSDGTSYLNGLRIGLVDERSEIAACYLGVPQNDVGRRTDVLDRCSKSEGMRILLRAMSPQVIAVDELGTEEDYQAVEQTLNSGSRILGTLHAADIQELKEKRLVQKWLAHHTFERYVVLHKEESGSRNFKIYDDNLELLC